jgi:hypothetical protein
MSLCGLRFLKKLLGLANVGTGSPAEPDSEMTPNAEIPSELKFRSTIAGASGEVLPLLAFGLALFYSNWWFTVIDDETKILSAATAPVSTTIGLFISGTGQHEHPPLYDVLLHFWLWLTSGAFIWLRVPAIVFFVSGLLILSQTAKHIGGRSSGVAVLWLGILWPYGFHFGRLAGWYSFTFLLASTLTWSYLRYCELHSGTTWAVMFLLALALVYTNYFGWAMLALLGLDYCLRNRRRLRAVGPYVLGTTGLLVASYVPLWRVFAHEVAGGTNMHQSSKVLVLNAAFNIYVLLVSESVAPWFWRLGVPATLSVVCCLVLAFAGARGEVRRFLVSGVLLLVAMDIIGILEPKRLLPVAPWLLLPIAVTLGTTKSRHLRGALTISLLIVGGTGWYGIFARRYYAAPRFIEPWANVAAQAAHAVHAGEGVIGNNPSFFFYLTYALKAPNSLSRWRFAGDLPEDVRYPEVWSPQGWEEAGRPLQSHMLWIRGMSSIDDGEAMERVGNWLDNHCGDRSDQNLLQDPGYMWKQRYLPDLGEVLWRVQIRQYSCKLDNTAPPFPKYAAFRKVSQNQDALQPDPSTAGKGIIEQRQQTNGAVKDATSVVN